MDRAGWDGATVTDGDLGALLSWGKRERAIARLLVDERLGYAEFLLRRQLSYDRLISETSPRGAGEHR